MGGQLRIIGGQWRGRRLRVAAISGLRPTTDRVRETLFNWLQPMIAGARCLDLFAGTGALGLEALSRGAGEVVFIERDRRAAAGIRDALALLGTDRGQVMEANGLAFLDRDTGAGPFDLVFLDPPFRKGLLGPACEALAAGGWLVPGARIYLETEKEAGPPQLPAGWTLLRSKEAGQVGYHLAETE